MSTAGILWPVSGKSSIQYNIPEIRAIKNENQALKILKSGSPLYCVDMELKYGRIRKGIEQPYLDDFTTKCAIDTIKRKKPNLLMMHLIDLDDAKHAYGTDSDEVKQVITRMDKRLGDIMQAVDEAGMKDDTIFLILGDHGQFNVRYRVHLNNLLQEKGLIYEENGEMKWRAYFQCGGGAAYLHIRQGDEEAEQIALAVIGDHMRDESSGIEKLYARDELDFFMWAKPQSICLRLREVIVSTKVWMNQRLLIWTNKALNLPRMAILLIKTAIDATWLSPGKRLEMGIL